MNDSPILYLENYRRRLQMRERFMTEAEYHELKEMPAPVIEPYRLPLALWIAAYLWGGILSSLIGYFLRQQEILHMDWWAIAGIVLGCWIVLGLVVAKLFGEMARED